LETTTRVAALALGALAALLLAAPNAGAHGGDPDGTVYANERSPATYLNTDRYGRADVPAGADPEAKPEWKEVSTGGRFAWHDHRAHYMSTGTPPQVEDPGERTKVFDYSIPIAVGSERGAIEGTLWWVGPPDDSAPILPFVALGVATLGLVALVIVVRRRRRRGGGDAGEAW
jgi:hypothetical protein